MTHTLGHHSRESQEHPALAAGLDGYASLSSIVWSPCITTATFKKLQRRCQLVDSLVTPKTWTGERKGSYKCWVSGCALVAHVSRKYSTR